MTNRPLAAALEYARARGFSLITVTLLLAMVMAFGVVLLSDVVFGGKIQKSYTSGLDAVNIADAGLQKALYCLAASEGSLCGGTFGDSYAGETNISFGEGLYSISITGQGDDKYILSTAQTEDGQIESVRMKVTKEMTTQAHPGLVFAIIGGTSGVFFQENAEVWGGGVRSSSSVACGNNSVLLGDISVAVPGGQIDNCFVDGDARADSILDSTVCGDAYYQEDPEGIAGSTVEGNSYPDSATPAETDMPSVDLPVWRAAAEAGGVFEGNYQPADGAVIGPLKITGDLIINTNATVTMAGPIWVLGDVTLENNSALALSNNFLGYSTVLLADNPADHSDGGRILVGNNAEVIGSGASGSFILVVSTSDYLGGSGEAAIDLRNNSAGGAIYLAPNGSVFQKNNSVALAVAGKKVQVEENAVVTFGCPAGGELTCGSAAEGCVGPDQMQLVTSPVSAWRFQKGTWQQL